MGGRARLRRPAAGNGRAAKEQLLGILGCMWAGSRVGPGRKFAQAVRGFGDRPECTVIGRKPFRTSARHAGVLNSVYAQVLEWEDWTFIVHSGASIIPTALAAGELARLGQGADHGDRGRQRDPRAPARCSPTC